MQVYIHKGRGFYIGSHVVVMAGTPETASQMIREKLDEIGLKNEVVKMSDGIPVTKECVIDWNNGDY